MAPIFNKQEINIQIKDNIADSAREDVLPILLRKYASYIREKDGFTIIQRPGGDGFEKVYEDGRRKKI
jgi:hypothetical protein